MFCNFENLRILYVRHSLNAFRIMENPNEMGQAENTENVKSSITNKFLDQSMDSDELSGSSVEGGKVCSIQFLNKDDVIYLASCNSSYPAASQNT